MKTPSYFEQAKTRQGFVAAMQRPRCGNCAHGVEQFGDRPNVSGWSCRLGGFFCSAHAACQAHESYKPMPVPGVSPAAGVAA